LPKYHKGILANTKGRLEYQHGHTPIHRRFNKLITALRTAVENGEGALEKGATSHDELFDSFRLGLMFWH
jgi:hypothetical protein